ncbi:MAG TPA: ankyrin repeat domain-containing protein [Chthonomonadaceae bacterium]|nr:ankyrin repeat domain-containing protein [Chthonomonadaceae bacterium]
MSVPEPVAAREALPPNPNLRHLKDQARDLLNAGQAQTLSEAQFQIARRYGFASWPKLKAYMDSLGLVGELKAAIDVEDLPLVKRLMTRHPDLHRAPMGYGNDGPLTWVAECRVPRRAPTQTRLEMARWMIENGSDVHQGGDGPLMRAALDDDRLPMLALLARYGADVNALWHDRYPIICAPCETLAPEALRWLLAHGADPAMPSQYGTPLSMLIGTYMRRPDGRHSCLEVMVDAGFALPDTPAIALHRGRIDLLQRHLERDASLLERRFSDAEIFPPELGLAPAGGLTATPVDGGTLLHLALEYDDLETARWLLEQGADPNARAAIDAEGFGGHTPLFHAVVSLGDRSDAKARLLLMQAADPNARATFRKQLRDMGDPDKERMVVFQEVTPIGYAHQYAEPGWVSEPALAALAAAGGGA